MQRTSNYRSRAYFLCRRRFDSGNNWCRRSQRIIKPRTLYCTSRVVLHRLDPNASRRRPVHSDLRLSRVLPFVYSQYLLRPCHPLAKSKVGSVRSLLCTTGAAHTHKLTSSQASQQGRPEQAAGLASPGLGVAAAQCSSLSQTADLFHQRLLSCRSYQRPATSDHPHHRYTAAAATAVARRDRSLCNKTSFDDS